MGRNSFEQSLENYMRCMSVDGDYTLVRMVGSMIIRLGVGTYGCPLHSGQVEVTTACG
jgi:hypothetical protein